MVAIIPNLNLKKDLGECLDSLKLSTFDNLQVVVVDNNSTDGSREFVKKNYPSVMLLESEVNLGYAGALNFGIRHIIQQNPDYIIAMNNDVLVPPTTISTLVDTLESSSNIAVAAPKILNYQFPTQTNSLGDRIYPLLPLPVRFGLNKKDSEKNNRIIDYDYIIGCFMVIRTKVLLEVGLFDTSYFMFFEDADLCRRIRDRKYRIVRDGRAKIYHKGSVSVKRERPQMIFLRARNRVWFYRRYRHGPHPIFTYIFLLLGSLSKIFTFLITGQFLAIYKYIEGSAIGFLKKVPPQSGVHL